MRLCPSTAAQWLLGTGGGVVGVLNSAACPSVQGGMEGEAGKEALLSGLHSPKFSNVDFDVISK